MCRLVGCIVLLAIGRLSLAQEQSWPKSPPSHPSRPGLFRLGPIYWTPTFHIVSVGIDTNVFYTPTDRQTDFTATGGPGLQAVLPAGRAFRAFLGGEIQYVYFLRTESQRRLGGNTRAGVAWLGTRFEATASETLARTYSRPSYEVDARILQDMQVAAAEVKMTTGRLLTRAGLVLGKTSVAKQQYRGVDLGQTLSRDEDRFLLGFEFRLTPKTFLIIEGDDENRRFPFDSTRDADSNLLCGGFRLDSKTRLSGRAVAGIRSYRPRHTARGANRYSPYFDSDLIYRLGRKTRIGVGLARDMVPSAFDSDRLPTYSQESAAVHLERLLVGRIDLLLDLRLGRLVSDGRVRMVTMDGETQTAVRDDRFWQAGADLGYRFRSRLRLGFAVTYMKRRSNFADLGIDGLLLGGTVTFTPPNP